MFSFLRRHPAPTDLLTSQLFDQDNFYRAFLRDLSNCTGEAVIESPFITTRRINELLPVLRNLSEHGVRVVVNTRHPNEHDAPYDEQARQAIAALQALDVVVLYTGGHHRKLAILDRTVVWEGSLNILSYSYSCEIMRRITSTVMAEQMISFLRIEKHFKEGLRW